MSIAGELVTERLEYDGGRQVTVYVPPDPPEAVVFAGDGQLISPWGEVLETACQAKSWSCLPSSATAPRAAPRHAEARLASGSWPWIMRQTCPGRSARVGIPQLALCSRPGTAINSSRWRPRWTIRAVRPLPVVSDLADDESHAALLATTSASFDPVDVLVNPMAP